MQHLDEGTIHSWLDGALSADEAAQVEAHVTECPLCAAAVAEARGFIAASSRILTALDHVPRGVVPAAPAAARWYNRAAWRAAAAVLVVAVGSLVVLRNGGNNAPGFSTMEEPDSAPILTPLPPIIVQSNPSRRTPIGSPQLIAPSSEKGRVKSAASDTSVAAVQTLAAPAPAAAYSGNPLAATQRSAPARANNALTGQVAGASTEKPAAPTGNAAPRIQLRGAVSATPQATAQSPVAQVTAQEIAKERLPLKVVGSPKMLGAKVTLYEIAPGDTVTLTEPMNVPLESVVTTSAGGAVAMSAGGAQADARRSATKTAVAPPARVDAAIAGAPEVVNGVTTISWVDSATGNVLKLSGRMSAARLQEIRIRIERERAAAKKNP